LYLAEIKILACEFTELLITYKGYCSNPPEDVHKWTETWLKFENFVKETVLIIENFGKFLRKVSCKWANKVRSATGSGEVGDTIIALKTVTSGREYCYGTLQQKCLLAVAVFCSTVKVF